MKKTVCMAALSALSLTWGLPARGQVADHLKCYKVKDPQKKTKYTADLGGLVAEPGCSIKVPAVMACVPTTKTIVGPPFPPGGGGSGTPNSFFCYKTKCPKTGVPPLNGTDQFGSRSVIPGTTKLVCAPLAAPPTTTSTTTSTTTTPTSSTTSTSAPGGSCSLLATGQTTCWDSGGNVIPCAGTGHDGETQAGTPLAYVDNGDGTITDLNTGLMWEKQCRDGSIHDVINTYTWDEAFSGHVATLNTMAFAGHTDWRLPNVRELQSIANYGYVNPAVAPVFNTNCQIGCTVLTCSCTGFAGWSSTSFGNGAWDVDFGAGSVGPSHTTNALPVRAVRGGS
jgi:hypothetical protein